MGFLRKLFGLGPKADLAEMISRKAKIIDVRSPGEFSGGHIKGSVNFPLDQFQSKIKGLNKNEPIIVCCASGMRSGSAMRQLKSVGFEDVANGGSWQSLQKYF